ncbi:MAG: tRNA (5-methylaminomethyl-2-thiouridylate)-methyltransferase [Cyanobacteria bacterium SZAS-4]|nr:tRNA (5-methylaminomethyl-2-thiouridylate)-methyltransferase [Cyanobacteria bacterium SZAS-4]
MKKSKPKDVKERPPVPTRLKQRFVFKLMHLIFVGVPLVAGIDKYFNLITDWEQYISPLIKPILPMSPKNAMRCAGVAEVAIGVVTIKKPRIGSSLFSGLMFGIILNLLTMRKQKHIASLDLCMGLFALCFALLLPDTERM